MKDVLVLEFRHPWNRSPVVMATRYGDSLPSDITSAVIASELYTLQ